MVVACSLAVLRADDLAALVDVAGVSCVSGNTGIDTVVAATAKVGVVTKGTVVATTAKVGVLTKGTVVAATAKVTKGMVTKALTQWRQPQPR